MPALLWTILAGQVKYELGIRYWRILRQLMHQQGKIGEICALKEKRSQKLFLEETVITHAWKPSITACFSPTYCVFFLIPLSFSQPYYFMHICSWCSSEWFFTHNWNYLKGKIKSKLQFNKYEINNTSLIFIDHRRNSFADRAR